jgi:hypothetical protein
MMTMHEVVLTKDESRFDERDEDVWFTTPEDSVDGEDYSDLWHDLKLDWDVWVRMGRPTTITMTINVGNVLDKDTDPADLIAGTQVQE